MEKFNKSFIVETKNRIDKFLLFKLDFSRNQIQKLIKNKQILVNDLIINKANFKVNIKDVIKVDTSSLRTDLIPENIPLDIIYEDDYLIVINKKSGIVVHPGPGHRSGTLVHALKFKFKKLSYHDSIRPGIVHRIDKDTSGLIIIAKNNEIHNLLAKQIKEHKIKRIYMAWVEGKMENKIFHINLPIKKNHKNVRKMVISQNNSKNAITHVFVQEIKNNNTLVECHLETGRTHQIRIHLSYINFPIVGDPIYGKYLDFFGQRLHAYKLEFVHPVTQKLMSFQAIIPKEFNILN